METEIRSNEEMQKFVDLVEEKFHPLSIFVYGSRARNDYKEDSDYEIGVFYRKDHKLSRSSLRELNLPANFNIYPFEHEAFLEYKIDTPFPEKVFLKELTTNGAMTIRGDKVVESLKPPILSPLDLLEEVNFENGMALAAILAYRLGDEKASRGYFYKSCLFSARCLVTLETGKFPITYKGIHDESIALGLGEYEEIVKKALQVRNGEAFNEKILFQSVDFLVRKVRRNIKKNLAI
jgi:predicted nucleotidyltransferase